MAKGPRSNKSLDIDWKGLRNMKPPVGKLKDSYYELTPAHQFIACSSKSGKTTDLESQRAIRRHVRQGLPRRQRPHDPNRVDIFVPLGLETPAPCLDTISSSSYLLYVPTNETVQSPPGLPAGQTSKTSVSRPLEDKDVSRTWPRRQSTSPISYLGQGRVDPFGNYPIKMNQCEHWLIDQVNSGEDLTLKNFRERWLPIAIQDPATFHQFLANVSLSISKLRGSHLDPLVPVAHHSLAVRCVGSKLLDPVLRFSDAVIASIVTFVCYSCTTEDFASMAIHLDGLEEAIALKGGLEALEKHQTLAGLVYGVDISAASRNDSMPRFSLREKFIQPFKKETLEELKFQQLSLQVPASWKQLFPYNHVLINIFEDFTATIAHAVFKTEQRETWKEVEFILYWIDPVIHKLLCIDWEVDICDPVSVIEEMCRLGLILFTGPIRRHCGKLGVSSTVYVKKLKSLFTLSPSNICWDTSKQPLILWAMFFGMLESWQLPEQDWFVRSLCLTAKNYGIDSWKDVLESVSSFLWMENMFELELGIFQDLVVSGLRSS